MMHADGRAGCVSRVFSCRRGKAIVQLLAMGSGMSPEVSVVVCIHLYTHTSNKHARKRMHACTHALTHSYIRTCPSPLPLVFSLFLYPAPSHNCSALSSPSFSPSLVLVLSPTLLNGKDTGLEWTQTVREAACSNYLMWERCPQTIPQSQHGSSPPPSISAPAIRLWFRYGAHTSYCFKYITSMLVILSSRTKYITSMLVILSSRTITHKY
jgi:hypothetical protein